MTRSRPLPLYATRLVGRDAELRTLAALPGCVTLVGPGGVGKTRLAAEAARSSGVPALFVDAAAAFDAAGLVRAVLRDLGSEAPIGREPLEEAAAAIGRDGIGLVVLDNLEQLGEHAAPVVQRLIEIPALRILATSRRAIGLPGERVVHVDPLPEDEAADVFFRALPRVGAARADPDRDGPAVRWLVAALDGNPLAIELAAGRTAVLPLDDVLRQVREAPARVLRDPSRPADRSSDLWRSVAWSCDMLPPAARLGLAHAAVFAGSFDLDAATAVIDTAGGAEDMLHLLVAWHLAHVVGPGRFALYQMVRAFALATSGDLGPAIERHAAFYLAKATRMADTRAPVAPLLEDAAEIDAIYERGLEDGAPPARLAVARRVAAKAYRLELTRRGPTEHRDLADRLIRAGGLDRDVLSLLACSGLMSLHLSDTPAARETFGTLQALARECRDPSQESRALLQLANVEKLEGRVATIAGLVDRALALAREANDRFMEMWALGGVGLEAAFQAGDYAFVAERLDLAIAIARTLPPDQLERMLHQRVDVDLAVRDWASARARIGEIRAIHAAESELAWFRTGMLAHIASMAAVAERGPDGADEAVAIADALTDARPKDRMEAQLLAGIALRLAGRGSARLLDAVEHLHLEPHADTRACQTALAAAACALDGRELPLDTLEPRSTGASAVLALARLVQDVALGRIPTEAAAEVTVAPPSAWTHVLGWVLDAAVAQRRAAALAWEIGPGGAWFRAPGAEPVDLSRSPRLARLLDALGGGVGLKVDEMFAAGWPGERARPESQANRVRVAVTTLRRAGLEILGWQRDRGWFLAADVRRVDR